MASRGESKTRWMAMTQVPAGLRHVGDQERPHLGGELDQLSVGQAVEVARTVDGLEDTHAFESRLARVRRGSERAVDLWKTAIRVR